MKLGQRGTEREGHREREGEVGAERDRQRGGRERERVKLGQRGTQREGQREGEVGRRGLGRVKGGYSATRV